ncbi:MAG: hypothetical protein WAO08_13360 [Hyphomicrobiaceae bacterium]
MTGVIGGELAVLVVLRSATLSAGMRRKNPGRMARGFQQERVLCLMTDLQPG